MLAAAGGVAWLFAARRSRAGEAPGTKKAPSRREYLKTAAVGVAGAGAAALGMPTIAKAQNKTWKLKLQSNWTGIGIESQDRAANLSSSASPGCPAAALR